MAMIEKTITIKGWHTWPQTPELILWLVHNIGDPGYVGGRWDWQVYGTWYRITFYDIDDYTRFILTHGDELNGHN